MVSIEKADKKDLVIYDITQVAPDRNRKDVGKLKDAVQAAERIQNPNRTQLLDLYHDVVTIDAHLTGIIDKRIKAVTNKKLHFVDRSGKRIDLIDDLINSQKFNDLMQLIVESIFYGFSSVEFVVGKEFDYVKLPRKHIAVERKEVKKSQYDFVGIPMEQLPFVWVVDSGDLGRLLQCSMYALYKRSGFGDFAQYVEIFGQPVRVFRYDAYDQQTKAELTKAIATTGSSLVMVIPKQAEYEMVDGKTSNGDGALQEKLINICNREMSIAILGNTETTNSSSSSGYAQASVHSSQQLEITKDDLKFVENTLNSAYFKNILKSYGYKVDSGSFKFETEIDLDALAKKIQIDTQVAQHVPIDADYWYKTYGVDKPDNYDELIKKKEADREVILKGIENANKDKKEAKELVASLVDFFATAP